MNIKQIVLMSSIALENYGSKWKDVELIITHIATKYMPSAEFYTQGMPAGFHPGFDNSSGAKFLYDLKRADNGEELNFSLYDWEIRLLE